MAQELEIDSVKYSRGNGRKLEERRKKKNVRNDAADKRQARRFAMGISRKLIAFHENRQECSQDRWSIPDPIQFFFVKYAGRTRIINKDEEREINVTGQRYVFERTGFLILMRFSAFSPAVVL